VRGGSARIRARSASAASLLFADARIMFRWSAADAAYAEAATAMDIKAAVLRCFSIYDG